MSSTISSFTIIGEPASKANSRRMVFNPKTKKPMFIKSKKALDYEKSFRLQCPVFDPPIDSDISVEIKIYYASKRPDLDESLILDLMQERIYLNDRQVKQKLITWGLNRDNPHAIITISHFTPDA